GSENTDSQGFYAILCLSGERHRCERQNVGSSHRHDGGECGEFNRHRQAGQSAEHSEKRTGTSVWYG
ncbi:unnamed protein product, partial [Sphagnum balticum]